MKNLQSKFFCTKHCIAITKTEALHHEDSGCKVVPYFGFSETEFMLYNEEKRSYLAWWEDMQVVK